MILVGPMLFDGVLLSSPFRTRRPGNFEFVQATALRCHVLIFDPVESDGISSQSFGPAKLTV